MKAVKEKKEKKQKTWREKFACAKTLHNAVNIPKEQVGVEGTRTVEKFLFKKTTALNVVLGYLAIRSTSLGNKEFSGKRRGKTGERN